MQLDLNFIWVELIWYAYLTYVLCRKRTLSGKAPQLRELMRHFMHSETYRRCFQSPEKILKAVLIHWRINDANVRIAFLSSKGELLLKRRELYTKLNGFLMPRWSSHHSIHLVSRPEEIIVRDVWMTLTVWLLSQCEVEICMVQG